MTDSIPYSSKKAGMAAREGALRLVHQVLSEKQLLVDAYRSEITEGPLRKLQGNDRAFARRIAITVLQHLGEIDQILSQFLEKGLPKKSGPLRNILRIGVAELLFLEVPAHAVVDSAVTHYRTWRKYAGFKGLTNAVLRRISKEGAEHLAAIDPARANLPDWLYESWTKAYGSEALAEMVACHQTPSTPLDLTLKAGSDKEALTHWAERLSATITPTGNLRLASHDRVDLLEGYQDGEWWVQDAAASLPAQLLGDVNDKPVLDLCAAPGGKTMQLAAKGAKVTALDMSRNRLDRVAENLERIGLQAELIKADALKFKSEKQWPAVLLDAPCSATGTMRRHPELVHQRKAEDIEHFAKLQARMLHKSAELVAPSGLLVFCTCSLQPQEGPELIGEFLTRNPDFSIIPIEQGELEGMDDFIQPDGSMRTRPDQWTELGGLDGFFAIRFRKTA